ncbi:alpha-D-glucose phosphate-specific phosphoglucomutase [Sphingomonas sp. AR_OL41]|uniref:alpha-D-glucose phosphate-specific phosphoglucomutase n=1 Tax=Sphingomonas sp. AR_OL41 TaxID=3042729 RepID=UPI00247FEFD9|nr:alpha-D-glucose phosphate-specific phosphoglucomutase [Sphingomonas sp. AR_OL41]MDH7972893.1 alpha-D-glucose phosphate-specific phosphoglucomutase [Sphingomonas sp. AR_OL41]
MLIATTTRPFADQRSGTSGLRRKVGVFRQEHYAANFIQSVFDVIAPCKARVLVLGGDGRFYSTEVIQLVIGMAAANGFARVVVGQGGILSSPAASQLIRARHALGGLILSAGHHSADPEGDLSMRFNGADGAPAGQGVTDAIYARSLVIDRYLTWGGGPIDLDTPGERRLGDMIVEIVDPVAAYAGLMETLFDFPLIRAMIADGFRVIFDAMNAATGPYAVELLERRLGAPAGSVVNAVPLPDFGGRHPDPNPVHARMFYDRMMAPDAPDFGAASDGEGGRAMIMGPGIYVAPSDALAVLVANADCAPAFSIGLQGVARSMPTSRAVDRVAQALGIDYFETPPGWKFFGNLLDAELVTICGEEGAGIGSAHIRDKDGLWTVLLWLNILARRRTGVGELVRCHWRTYGRHYYVRHDYENIAHHDAAALMAALRVARSGMPGTTAHGRTIFAADEFIYRDPIDHWLTSGQGFRVSFEDDARIVFCLSDTASEGVTLRVHLERYEPPDGPLDLDVGIALQAVADAARQIARIGEFTGRAAADVVS